MNRRTLQLLLFTFPLAVISSLLSCRSSRDAQAPVAASASPLAFHYDPNDLRPPMGLGDTESEPARMPPAAIRESELPEPSALRASEAGLINASLPLAPNALAKAAQLYVEAQELEVRHAFPQAVAAYDRLLMRNETYADAKARRDTLLELVRMADEYYVLAMDAEGTSERLYYLNQVAQFWPEYRDVKSKIQQLKKSAAQVQEQQADVEKARDKD